MAESYSVSQEAIFNGIRCPTIPMSQVRYQFSVLTVVNGLLTYAPASAVNPFDQSLNTTDNVQFASVRTTELRASTLGIKNTTDSTYLFVINTPNNSNGTSLYNLQSSIAYRPINLFNLDDAVNGESLVAIRGNLALYKKISGIPSTMRWFSGNFELTIGVENLSQAQGILFPNYSGVVAIARSQTDGNVSFDSVESDSMIITNGINTTTITNNAGLLANIAVEMPLASGTLLTGDQAVSTTSDVLFNSVDVATTYKIANEQVLKQVSADSILLVGQDAGATVTGAGNTAVGVGAMSLGATSGTENTAVGHFALCKATTADESVCIGHSAGLNVTTGDNNVLIGGSTAYNMITGANNTIIGTSSGNSYTGAETNNILLGYNVTGTVGESNVCRIGNSNITNNYLNGSLTLAAGGAITNAFLLTMTNYTDIFKSILRSSLGTDVGALLGQGIYKDGDIYKCFIGSNNEIRTAWKPLYINSGNAATIFGNVFADETTVTGYGASIVSVDSISAVTSYKIAANPVLSATQLNNQNNFPATSGTLAIVGTQNYSFYADNAAGTPVSTTIDNAVYTRLIVVITSNSHVAAGNWVANDPTNISAFASPRTYLYKITMSGFFTGGTNEAVYLSIYNNGVSVNVTKVYCPAAGTNFTIQAVTSVTSAQEIDLRAKWGTTASADLDLEGFNMIIEPIIKLTE